MGLTVGAVGLLLGTAGVSIEPAASTRTWKLLASIKQGYTGEFGTNAFLWAAPLAVLTRSGGGDYKSMDLQPAGLMGPGGNLHQKPNDAVGMTSIVGSLMEQARNFPDYYNGETIVHDMASGTLGTGGQLRFLTGMAGTNTIIDATPTGYRREHTIADVTTLDVFIPYADFTTAAGAVLDEKRRLYLKSHEALVDDIPNNLWKSINPDALDRLQGFDAIRMVDGFSVNELSASHFLDYGQVDDPHWVNASNNYGQDNDLQVRAPTGRQGMPLLVMLDTAAHTGQIGWINASVTFCSPLRMTARTMFYDNDLDYYEDGVQSFYAENDIIAWFDPRWIKLSTLSVASGPTKGQLTDTSRLTTRGEFVYNPLAGTPHDSETVEYFTVSGTQIVHDLTDGANDPTDGSSGNFIVPLRVLNKGGGEYYCRLQASQIWPQNRDWMANPARWQSIAREFVDKLVASNYPTDRILHVEAGNENWNFGGPFFERNYLYCFGVGTAYTSEIDTWKALRGLSIEGNNATGAGIYLAFLKHYIEAELTARSLSYNLAWTLGSQAANSDWTRNWIYGWMFAHEVLFGYTWADLPAQENPKLHICVTNYIDGWSGQIYETNSDNHTTYGGVATKNLTKYRIMELNAVGDGVETVFTIANGAGPSISAGTVRVYFGEPEITTGWTASVVGSDIVVTFDTPPPNSQSIRIRWERNAAELLDRFDGTNPLYADDSTDLEDEIVAWHIGALVDRNNAKVAADWATHKAICDLWGVTFSGAYEGGNHEYETFIPADFRNSTRENSLGETPSEWLIRFYNSAKFGTIVTDLYEKLIAVAPNGYLCQYGAMVRKTLGEPWSWGAFQEAATGEGEAILSYGRLA